MEINFSIDGEIDIVAAYAASVSTIVALCQFILWRSRHAIELEFLPNMELIPSSDGKQYIVARVVNKGQTQTVITNYLGYHWENKIDYFFKRNRKAFIINETSIPAKIQPGEQWQGFVTQDDKMLKMARKGLLYLGIAHTMGKKEILRRVKISQNGK